MKQKSRISKSIILISLFIVTTVLLVSWKNNPADDTLLVNAAVDKIMKDEIIKQNLVGAAIGVIKNGKIEHLKGYGFTHLSKKTPVTTKTAFRWASISKTLTAVAALQLDEQKSDFSINDKVTKHIDFWTSSKTNWKSQVTIKHLLSNRSGIQHYGKGRDNDGDNKPDKTYSYDASKYTPDQDGYNAKKAVDVFKSADLDFKPGTMYLYSTFGFNLLGAVLDYKTSKGHVDFIQKNIANKIGMSSLKVSKGKFRGYQKNCDGELNGKSIGSVEWKLPGGGWESNIRDLARFAAGIMNGKLLKNTSRLWTTVNGNGKYCYGISKSGSGSNFRVWHSGAHDNVRTYMHIYPNEKYGVVLMSNGEYTEINRIIQRIHKLYGKSWNPDISPLDKCRDGKSCNGKFAGVWRKTNKDVIIRRGYSHDNFYEEWKRLRAAGYYCDDFEAYEDGSTVRWDGIFRKGSGKNAIWRNFDSDGFSKKWKEESKKGYRLVDLETYKVGKNRKWAGLFREGKGKYALYRNYDHDGFNAKWKQMAKEGKKLIDIEVYKQGGKLKWSGVWIEGKDGLLNRNYDSSEFGKLFKKRLDKGYKLIDVESYRDGNKTKWAGIWEKSSTSSALYRNYDFCDLMEKHEELSGKGYELLDMERY